MVPSETEISVATDRRSLCRTVILAALGAGRPHESKAVSRLPVCAEAGNEIVQLRSRAVDDHFWKPEDDWFPIVVEDMRLKHAAEMLKPRRRED